MINGRGHLVEYDTYNDFSPGELVHVYGTLGVVIKKLSRGEVDNYLSTELIYMEPLDWKWNFYGAYKVFNLKTAKLSIYRGDYIEHRRIKE